MAGAVGNHRGIHRYVACPDEILHILTCDSLLAVLIGCCPGLYRIIKARLSPSVQSYHYGSYAFQRPSGNALPSYNPHIHGGKDIALSCFSVLRSHSSDAYRLNSLSSSQEKLASPKESSNIVLTSRVGDRHRQRTRRLSG